MREKLEFWRTPEKVRNDKKIILGHS